MSKRLESRYPPRERPLRIAEALRLLREARNILRDAGAPLALAAVRRAMKSTEGAERHAWCQRSRLRDA
jgi:hypothetical protein